MFKLRYTKYDALISYNIASFSSKSNNWKEGFDTQAILQFFFLLTRDIYFLLTSYSTISKSGKCSILKSLNSNTSKLKLLLSGKNYGSRDFEFQYKNRYKDLPLVDSARNVGILDAGLRFRLYVIKLRKRLTRL